MNSVPAHWREEHADDLYAAAKAPEERTTCPNPPLDSRRNSNESDDANDVGTGVWHDDRGRPRPDTKAQHPGDLGDDIGTWYVSDNNRDMMG